MTLKSHLHSAINSSYFPGRKKQYLLQSHSSKRTSRLKATQHAGAARDFIQQLPENKRPVVSLTDGADYAGVARCDWLLVNVQQTKMLQESVGHAGVQALALDERVRLRHRLPSSAGCKL